MGVLCTMNGWDYLWRFLRKHENISKPQEDVGVARAEMILKVP